MESERDLIVIWYYQMKFIVVGTPFFLLYFILLCACFSFLNLHNVTHKSPTTWLADKMFLPQGGVNDTLEMIVEGAIDLL